MIDHNDYLVTALRAYILTFPQALHRASLIPQAVVENAVEVTGNQTRQKTLTMMNDVADKVKIDPQNFYKFCRVLDEQGCRDEAKKLREHCESLKQE